MVKSSVTEEQAFLASGTAAKVVQKVVQLKNAGGGNAIKEFVKDETGAIPGKGATTEAGKGSPLPVPQSTVASNGLTYQSHTKHTVGQAGNRPNAGIEPKNSLGLFNNSVNSNSSEKHRYSLDSQGNLHRFSYGNNGTWHWSGSTGQGDNSLKGSQVPNDIKNKFNLPKKGW